ncbi:hypothetical protein Pint_34125 [Pistacia integerrima]|nr:hypothetical protein Pint_34150 [Pistacia integerrima]KAJ0009726.1 hypothetical protein Pint_34149 [Pistacia integerrima]KAJ0011224.1 hypothetical protein Pint_34125 [Pistacia integerrima]KAJ0074631.1 hypothetical protein Patl1_37464 [Pistacia atlantica]
MKMISI